MRRGTTPTLTFTIPGHQFNPNDLTALSIVFVQCQRIILEKKLRDVTLTASTIIVTLTEKETLAFRSGETILIQIRGAIGNKKVASQVMSTRAEVILKDGELR